jgi:hypothetical protein
MRRWLNDWYHELMLFGMVLEITLIFYLCLKAH